MTEQPMALMDALGALRRGLIIAGSAWLVAFAAVYGYAEALFRWLAEPMRQVLPQGSTMVFLTATEPFFTYLMLAAVAALVVSLPVILWQAWTLIMAAFPVRQKGLGFPFILVGCLAFCLGAYLGFFFVFPLIFSVLIHFGVDAGGINAMLSMGDYLDLALKMMLAFGLVFELPLVMFVLTGLGVADSAWFAARRKYMLIVAFIFGGVVTPGPDVFSQCSIAIPFVILYEIGILGARLARKPAGKPAPLSSLAKSPPPFIL
ncbi:MAG: twin-arginine translocase subunit TatC [Desulfuromonadales bacterium]|nr:twin-arginine translocase subunit TatC [Desulfuromonadales bacterium]